MWKRIWGLWQIIGWSYGDSTKIGWIMSHLLQKHEPLVTYSKRKRQLLKNTSHPFFPIWLTPYRYTHLLCFSPTICTPIFCIQHFFILLFHSFSRTKHINHIFENVRQNLNFNYNLVVDLTYCANRSSFFLRRNWRKLKSPSKIFFFW